MTGPAQLARVKYPGNLPTLSISCGVPMNVPILSISNPIFVNVARDKKEGILLNNINMQLVFRILAITMLVITILCYYCWKGEHDQQLMFQFAIKYRS